MGRPKKVIDGVEKELVEQGELITPSGVTTDPTTPKYGSKEWSDYVLDQLQDDEKDDKGHPNVHGLRRLAEDLLGPFLESGPVEVKASLDGESSGRAYCVYQIVVYPFMVNSDQPAIGDGLEKRVYRATADSYRGNTDDVYSVYPVAMAEVRAETRCLRRMLKLREVSSEELTSKNANETLAREETNKVAATFDNDDSIATSQIFIIKDKCRVLNIDLMKLVNSGEKQYTAIEEMTKETAAKVIQRLTQYQTQAVPVPSEFLLA